MKLNEMISEKLNELGYSVGFASIEAVNDLENEIKSRVDKADIDRDLYEHRMSWFNFNPYEVLAGNKTIIIVSVPQNAISVSYLWKGKNRKFILPPTYIFSPIGENLLEIIRKTLEPFGFTAENAALPEKLLATRTGLAKYGRNNITYVEGSGSYHRLFAFFTDMPCENPSWRKPELLEQCEFCSNCVDNCPTKCIKEEKFIINAERCLTHFNESRKPFPDWIKDHWHNAIIGCLKCQTICPANPKLIVEESHISFSEFEVKQIINQTPKENLQKETWNKLKELCIHMCYSFIGRNLKVLISD